MATVWVNPGSPVRYAASAGAFSDRSGQENTGPALLLESVDGDRVVVEGYTPEVLLAYLDRLRDQVVALDRPGR